MPGFHAVRLDSTRFNAEPTILHFPEAQTFEFVCMSAETYAELERERADLKHQVEALRGLLDKERFASGRIAELLR